MATSLKRGAEIETPYGRATVTKGADTTGTAKIRYADGDTAQIHKTEQWRLITPGK